MSDILGPEAVERVRRRMQRADMYEVSLTEVDCLIATIDALAEALRAEHIFRTVSMGDETGMDEVLSAQDAANTAVARVAAWLEET